MKSRIPSFLPPIAAAILLVGVGLALAATTNLESLRVGTAGQGGVTFFNGSIVNESGPVVVADDLRVDGRITRLDGETNKPVIVNDDLEVQGDVDADNLYTKNEASDTFVSQSLPTWDTQAGKIAVGPSFFVPSDSSAVYTVSTNALIVNSGAGETFGAGLQLPDGATVTGFWMYYTDNSAGENVTARLRGADEDAGIFSLATLTSDGEGDAAGIRALKASSISNAAIDNDTNVYEVQVEIVGSSPSSSTLSFRRAIVFYDFTKPY